MTELQGQVLHKIRSVEVRVSMLQRAQITDQRGSGGDRERAPVTGCLARSSCAPMLTSALSGGPLPRSSAAKLLQMFLNSLTHLIAARDSCIAACQPGLSCRQAQRASAEMANSTKSCLCQSLTRCKLLHAHRRHREDLEGIGHALLQLCQGSWQRGNDSVLRQRHRLEVMAKACLQQGDNVIFHRQSVTAG